MSDIKERLRAFDSFAVNPQICKEAADHIATLEASVAANQKDAERYRWVRDGLGCDVRSREEYLTGEELDAAIDSSIAPDTSTQEVG